jgi:hypothetical protein
MKYWTPQFIDIEDKIIGPLTIKQFVYLAGGAGAVVLLNTILPFFVALLLGAPIVVLGVALAFYKINDQPFIQILESAFQFVLHGRLYLWKKRTKKVEKGTVAKTPTIPISSSPQLSESKLRNLAWSLDIKESLGSEEVNGSANSAKSSETN